MHACLAAVDYLRAGLSYSHPPLRYALTGSGEGKGTHTGRYVPKSGGLYGVCSPHSTGKYRTERESYIDFYVSSVLLQDCIALSAGAPGVLSA